MDKKELLQYNHSNIQELIRFIDQKAGALLVIYGFLFTATVEFAKKLKFINPFSLKGFLDSFISISLLVVGTALISLLIYQVYIVLFGVIKPRIAQNYTQEERSIIYFDHISKRSKQEYIDHFNKISDDKFHETIEKEMLEQIYEISCIMSQKSEKFNSVLGHLFLSIFLLLVFIFLCNIN